MASKPKTKGRARILIEERAVPMGIEPPKEGETIWNALEVKEHFDTWKAHLLLPDGYEVIGVFFDVPSYDWNIIVESEHLEVTPNNKMLPLVWPTYQIEDGKMSISKLIGISA